MIQVKEKKQPGNGSTHLAVKAPGCMKVQRNEEQTVAKEGKILAFLHQTAPLNNWGAVIVS